MNSQTPQPWNIYHIQDFLNEEEDRSQEYKGILTQSFTYDDAGRENIGRHHIMIGKTEDRITWRKYIWNERDNIVAANVESHVNPPLEELGRIPFSDYEKHRKHSLGDDKLQEDYMTSASQFREVVNRL